MRAGRLRARVQFEAERYVGDGQGGAEDGKWRLIAECRGEYYPERGREQVAAGRLESSQAGVLRVRYCQAVAAIGTSMRVLIDDVPHQIRSGPTDPDMRRRTLEFVVEKGVAPHS